MSSERRRGKNITLKIYSWENCISARMPVPTNYVFIQRYTAEKLWFPISSCEITTERSHAFIWQK